MGLLHRPRTRTTRRSSPSRAIWGICSSSTLAAICASCPTSRSSRRSSTARTGRRASTGSWSWARLPASGCDPRPPRGANATIPPAVTLMGTHTLRSSDAPEGDRYMMTDESSSAGFARLRSSAAPGATATRAAEIQGGDRGLDEVSLSARCVGTTAHQAERGRRVVRVTPAGRSVSRISRVP